MSEVKEVKSSYRVDVKVADYPNLESEMLLELEVETVLKGYKNRIDIVDLYSNIVVSYSLTSLRSIKKLT